MLAKPLDCFGSSIDGWPCAMFIGLEAVVPFGAPFLMRLTLFFKLPLFWFIFNSFCMLLLSLISS